MSKVFRDFYKINFMNKGVILGISIATVVIAGVIIVLMMDQDGSEKIEVEDTLDKEVIPIDNPEIGEKIKEIEKIAGENEYDPEPRDWQTSGPFQIDRSQYALGEKIFMRIGGLQFQEKGQVAVMRPLNDYLDPQLSKVRGLCSVDDVLGKWALVFRGTDYPNLNFEIVNKTVPGTDWEPVC